MGFQTLALEKRSAEVWETLGAVKTRGGGVLDTQIPEHTKVVLSPPASLADGSKVKDKK